MNSIETNEVVPPVSNFQAKGRTITLSYSNDEIQEVNGILSELQAVGWYSSDTMKGLFLQILRNSIKKPKDLNGIQHEFQTDLTKEVEDKTAEINALQVEIGLLTEKNDLLTSSIEELGNIEITEVETELKPKETDIYIQLDEQKTFILQTIADNRHVKRYDADKLSVSEIAEKLIFNKATLYNWGGEIFTGLK